MKARRCFALKSVVPALFVFAALGLIPVSLRADALDNWTRSQIVTNPIGFMGSLLTGVTYGQGRFVAVGEYAGDDNGVIQTSDDGLTWTKRTTQDYSILDLYDVAYGNGVFVAVGWDAYSGRNIYSSTNGIIWSPHFTSVANVRSVTYGGGLFVAGTDGALLQPSTATTNRNIYTSADGISWTARNSGSPAGDVQAITGVSYGANIYVGVDQSKHSYVSPTGISGWQRYTNALVGNSVRFCNGYFITPTGVGTNSISTDGINWVTLTNDTGATFQNLINAAGVFLAFSATGIYTSTNMTNWTARTLPVNNSRHLQAGAFGGGRFLVVGYNYPPSPLIPMGYVSDSISGLAIAPGSPPTLQISGLLQRLYRIDQLTNMCSNNWQAIGTMMLTNSPLAWPVPVTTNDSGFYRAVLLP